MDSKIFTIVKKDPHSLARAGLLNTAHGPVETPIFMPVGTRGTVKAIGPDDLSQLGAQIVLANTYHLMLRPGTDLISSMGSLHNFMGWKGPILTDSGGYQVYSLSALRKLSEEGLWFRSPYDGKETFFSPEKAIEVQKLLGVDIMMCLDECTNWPASRAEAEKSMTLTLNWAKRCRAQWDPDGPQLLFGISQGSFFPDLRKKSAQDIGELDFPGQAVGGLALGESLEERLLAIESARSGIDENKPMYLMGLGTPLDIIEGIKRGADFFDCVLPTRNARNGQFFTRKGRLTITNARFKDDLRPPDEQCTCYTCQTFSRAYLRHLCQNHEPLYLRLASLHNLHYYLDLVTGAREALLNDRFSCYYKEFYNLLNQGQSELA